MFEISPAVKGADHAVSRILADAFPKEAPSLYRRYIDSYSSEHNVVNLTLVAAFGDGAPR